MPKSERAQCPHRTAILRSTLPTAPQSNVAPGNDSTLPTVDAELQEAPKCCRALQALLFRVIVYAAQETLRQAGRDATLLEDLSRLESLLMPFPPLMP